MVVEKRIGRIFPEHKKAPYWHLKKDRASQDKKQCQQNYVCRSDCEYRKPFRAIRTSKLRSHVGVKGEKPQSYDGTMIL